jgi:hypothetical protein
MFSPDTIYKDIIKLVHPDINPQLKDATLKTQMVTALKGRPDELRFLAIRWGFIQATSQDKIDMANKSNNFNPFRAQTNNTFNRSTRPNYEQHVFDLYNGVIFRTSKYAGLRGIIVKISKTHSKFGDNTNYMVYIINLDKFVTLKLRQYSNVNTYFNKFNPSITETEYAKVMYEKYKNRNSSGIVSLSDLGLKPNTKYTFDNIFVKAKVKGRIGKFRVSRTTTKCVVVEYGYGDITEHTVRLTNVYGKME